MINLKLAQINPTVGDIAGNAGQIIDIWASADAAQNCDLVIFPELALSGYPPEDLIINSNFINKIEGEVKALCEQANRFTTAALITTPWRINTQIHNCALLIENGAITAIRAKHHLPNYGVFDEKRIFAAGPLPDPIPFKGHKLGVMICEDMWYPDIAQHLKSNGADILIVPNASPWETSTKANKQTQREYHARKRVTETNLPLIYVNQIGGQDELVFDGNSFVMDGRGTITHHLNAFATDAIDYTHPTQNTAQSPTTNNQSPTADIYAALKLGLHDYVTKNGFNGVLLGLSGGIDSALAAAIAVDALGADRVKCYMLPSPFTSRDSLEDAKECAAMLGTSYDILPINDAMTAFETTIPDLNGVAHENMQSRIRGLILMALSNASGDMLLTTGNKSEMAVGYATLYGDMNGGFNALKDVYKTQVYALAKWRNDQGNQGPAIPERIITKAPSAELRDNQTDQDSLPDYDALDDILCGLIENQDSLDAIAARGHAPATIQKIAHLLRITEYKRYQSPPGTKITPRAFGRDRRYPMTNGWKFD